jgi:hypothetical protein
METIEKSVDVGKQPVEDAEVGILAVIDFLDQLFEAVKNCTKVFMFAFDDGDRVH